MSLNRLGQETSPYLLQHRNNPVHWWAWGPEAIAEAKRTGKPILLSVGYAACHWCHVMAHESFEDEATAGVMNELFVNIKVDREERPDIDAIYMGALHRLGQQGGWPLTMFLDSGAKPFWGGTYFPPTPRWGKPAFSDVLREVARIYREERDKVSANTSALTEMLSDRGAEPGGIEITESLVRDLTARMVRAVDLTHGGINGAPKFPQWSFFWLLWRGGIRFGNAQALKAVEITLVNICQGGIYDHLGGGFARYSVDEQWLVPHFEKMLYDNALLIDLLTEVWRETRNPLFKVRGEETAGWLLREMVAEGGGFAASLDADSEGEEGKFYVWTAAEIERVLGAADTAYFSAAYDVSPEGNWEGHTILNRLAESGLRSADEECRLKSLREKLLAARSSRIRPGWDDKVLADWNGLMIAALARAATVFDRPEWLAAAERAFAFITSSMSDGDRLWHSWRQGRAKAAATASDYANMIWAALRLHEATLKPEYLVAAQTWSDVLDRRFWSDASGGGYAMTADDTDDVIVRLRVASDDATPNANAIQLSNLIALHTLTGESRYADRAETLPLAFGGELARNILGYCGLMAAALDLGRANLIVLVRDGSAAIATFEVKLNAVSIPGALQYTVEAGRHVLPEALKGKAAPNGGAAVYICTGPRCTPPIVDGDALISGLRAARASEPVAGSKI